MSSTPVAVAVRNNSTNRTIPTINGSTGLQVYPGREVIPGNDVVLPKNTNRANSKTPKCIKPTPAQKEKNKKKMCFKMIQKFDLSPLINSLNKLKNNIIDIDKKLLVIKYKGSSKKKSKKNTHRCDSEDVSFTKIKKKFIYSINVLESSIKKMKKLEISDENKNEDECEDETSLKNSKANKVTLKNGKGANKVNSRNGKGANNINSRNGKGANNVTLKNGKGANKVNSRNIPPPAYASFGGSSTNDICSDYIGIAKNTRDIISHIGVILNARDDIVINNECMMTEIIFDKFQKSKSNFEEISEKLNNDQRLSTALGNGPALAPTNGTRYKTN